MKKIFFAFILAIWAVSSFAQPELKFVQEYVKHDTLYMQDESEVYRCYYTNTGDSPLYLTSAKSFCPCVVPTYPEEALAPGDTAYVTLTFTFSHEGKFRHPVNFYYFKEGEDEDPRGVVTILGYIKESKDKETESEVLETNN